MKRFAPILMPLLLLGLLGCGSDGGPTGPGNPPAEWSRSSAGLPGDFVISFTASGTTAWAGTAFAGVWKHPL